MQHSTYRLTNLLKHNSGFYTYCWNFNSFLLHGNCWYSKVIAALLLQTDFKILLFWRYSYFWVMTEYRNNMNLHVVYICKGTVHIHIKWCFWRIRFNSTCKASLWKCGCPSSKGITLPLHVGYVWNGDMVKERLLAELPWNFWVFSNSISCVLPDCMHIRKKCFWRSVCSFFCINNKSKYKETEPLFNNNKPWKHRIFPPSHVILP